MAVTAIQVDDQKLLFMTVEAANREGSLDVDIHLADENFMPIGKPSLGHRDGLNEEEYHKQLRKEAKEKGHFVKDHSTNPEWNPE